MDENLQEILKSILGSMPGHMGGDISDLENRTLIDRVRFPLEGLGDAIGVEKRKIISAVKSIEDMFDNKEHVFASLDKADGTLDAIPSLQQMAEQLALVGRGYLALDSTYSTFVKGNLEPIDENIRPMDGRKLNQRRLANKKAMEMIQKSTALYVDGQISFERIPEEIVENIQSYN